MYKYIHSESNAASIKMWGSFPLQKPYFTYLKKILLHLKKSQFTKKNFFLTSEYMEYK